MTEDEGRAFQMILGRKLRQLREGRNWSRDRLAAEMGWVVGERTLLSYEHGTRALLVNRFRQICRALGVSASDVLQEVALEMEDICSARIHVHLGQLIHDTSGGRKYAAVRGWAAGRVKEHGDAQEILSAQTIGALATAFTLSHRDLAIYLMRFSSQNTPFQWNARGDG